MRGVRVPPPAEESGGPGYAGGSASWAASVGWAAPRRLDAGRWAGAAGEALGASSGADGGGGGPGGEAGLGARGGEGSRVVEVREPLGEDQRRRGWSSPRRTGWPAVFGRDVSSRRREPEPLLERSGDGELRRAESRGGAAGERQRRLRSARRPGGGGESARSRGRCEERLGGERDGERRVWRW
jgi:hypothetical protein